MCQSGKDFLDVCCPDQLLVVHEERDPIGTGNGREETGLSQERILCSCIKEERALEGEEASPSWQIRSRACSASYLTRTSVSQTLTPQLRAFWKDIRVFSGASWREKACRK